MEINGPIKVGVVEPTPQGNYELHIDFTDDFKAAELAAAGRDLSRLPGRTWCSPGRVGWRTVTPRA